MGAQSGELYLGHHEAVASLGQGGSPANMVQNSRGLYFLLESKGYFFAIIKFQNQKDVSVAINTCVLAIEHGVLRTNNGVLPVRNWSLSA